MIKFLFSIITIICLTKIKPCHAQNPQELKLKDFRPQSIFQVPVTKITKAKYPVLDMHSHDFAKTDEQVAQWVKTMDQAGIEKTIILSGATGSMFDSIYSRYNRYPDRFLFGTDTVAPAGPAPYYAVFDMWAPVWKQLTAETSLKVRKTNYERIFDEGRRRVREWEKANVK